MERSVKRTPRRNEGSGKRGEGDGRTSNRSGVKEAKQPSNGVAHRGMGRERRTRGEDERKGKGLTAGAHETEAERGGQARAGGEKGS